jgi:hypothetical protein
MMIDRLRSFLDNVSGGAWSFLVREMVCLVNSDNARDLISRLPSPYLYEGPWVRLGVPGRIPRRQHAC